jgi:hypothetical protein
MMNRHTTEIADALLLPRCPDVLKDKSHGRLPLEVSLLINRTGLL